MEGPTNLGINLPLSTKPTNANTNSNSLGNNNSVNNNNDGGTINSNDRGEKKSSTSPQKKTNSNDSAVQKKSASMGYTCGDCQTLFSSREVYVSHMRREHGKVSLWLWWPGFAYLSWSLNILLHKGKFWKLISYSLSLSFGRFWRSIHADSVKSPSAPRTVFVDTIVSNIKGCGRYTPVREYSWTHHQMCAPSKSWVPDLFCAEAHHPTLH